MKYGINPANLHEFTRDVAEFYGEGNFEVIAELNRVYKALDSWSSNSQDPLDAIAFTLDSVILEILSEQYTKVQESMKPSKEQPKKPDKESK